MQAATFNTTYTIHTIIGGEYWRSGSSHAKAKQQYK